MNKLKHSSVTAELLFKSQKGTMNINAVIMGMLKQTIADIDIALTTANMN